MSEQKDDLGLHWYALNFRTAGIVDAEVAWQALKNYVNDKLSAANARIAELERQIACARAVALHEALSSIKEDKMLHDSGAHAEYINGYNDACFEHVEELTALADTPLGFVCVEKLSNEIIFGIEIPQDYENAHPDVLAHDAFHDFVRYRVLSAAGSVP